MENLESISNAELMNRLQAGEEKLFNMIYDHYWQQLFLAAHARLNDELQAEEVVQKVFFRLWNKKSGIEIRNLKAYLAAMTRYAVYEHLAHESRIKEREKVWSGHNCQPVTTIDQIENRFLLTFIHELSSDLPEKCRMVFVSNKLEDQSLAEVAGRMNISQKTAEAHLTKALCFIRLKLDQLF